MKNALNDADALGSTADIFLSSVFLNFKDIREEICSLDKRRIWAVEIERPELDTRKGVPHFVIVDALVEQIRNSKVFICVLRDHYGSSVFADTESVSFFETEIYQAALYHNNAHFFLMEPFKPSPRLEALLNLVRTVRPGIIPERAQPKKEVFDGIKRVLVDTRNTRRRPWAISLRKLVSELAFRRGDPKPDIEFFDKVFSPVSDKPDKDHVRVLLDGLAGETGMEKRLTRMWVALRELSAAPYDQPEFAEYLPLWDQALGAWSSAAAWYGLHGHLYAGRLSAVNSMLKIRGFMDWSRAEHDADNYIQGTKGARASEYFSVAKLCTTQSERDKYLSLALKNVDEAMAAIAGDPSGFLSIHGHIRLEQGALADARADFERMKSLRIKCGDAGGIGEALADLGLVEAKLGNLREARRLFRQGMEMQEAAGRIPFAIMAQKRLAKAYLRSGHPILALNELCAAYDKAQEHQIFGQITPLMESAHELACRLGIWRRRE